MTKTKNCRRAALVLAALLLTGAASCGGGGGQTAAEQLSDTVVATVGDIGETLGIGTSTTSTETVATTDTTTDTDTEQGPPPGHHGRGFHPVFGEITSLTAESVTITPEIPAFITERMEERGIEPPDDAAFELPDEITALIDEETTFFVEGEEVESNPFAVGDKVGMHLSRAEEGAESTALSICDSATAEQRMQERAERFDKSGEARGRHHGRPASGEIVSLSGESMTIEPEVPAFITELMAEQGIEPPTDTQFELPDEITVLIDEETQFFVAGEEVADNPFSVGDQVAVRMGWAEEGEDAVAIAISDYATAEARMAEFHARMEEHRAEMEARGVSFTQRGRPW